VLVTERSEQLLQGASMVPPVADGGPASTSVTTDPASEGSAGSAPVEASGDLGSGASQLKQKDPVRQAKSRLSRSRSTTSARSFMRQKPGILRCINSFMPFSLRPGNSITISRPTRLWW
jgi:hypothetical protein